MGITKRVVLIGGAILLASCAGNDRRMSHGAEIPSAVGDVRFQPMGEDGLAIDLRVRNLREPEELIPPGYAYVAWVQDSRDAAPRNVGVLSLNADLSGELRTLTPLAFGELFVTAEAAADVERPTGRRLLWTSRD